MGRKKKAVSLAKPKTASHLNGTKPMMVLISTALHEEFAAFRAERRLNRDFPWAVRDCMEVAIRDYIKAHGNLQETT